jgi:hypothetical protein
MSIITACSTPQKIQTSDLSSQCKKKLSETHDSSLLMGKNEISEKTCIVCFRKFQMDPKDHEKHSFRNIVVDLRILDKLS